MVVRVLIFLLTISSLSGSAAGGYKFLEGTTRTSIRFELFEDLIVIPAQINDTLSVRLILDTGTRSMLLYGKRFARLQNLSANRKVKISGWGSPQEINASFSFPNSIRIGSVMGEGLGIAVVTTKNLFENKRKIDGIIGYELFAKFVVEINYKTRFIHLYENMPSGHTQGFSSVPLEINKAMPQVKSTVVLNDKTKVELSLLVDTGSSLGLTLFSKEKFEVYSSGEERPIGIGLNGVVKGFDLYNKHFLLGDLLVKFIPSYVVNVEEHPDDKFSFCGSVGADFLKKHVVIFDYPSSRMFLRKA